MLNHIHGQSSATKTSGSMQGWGKTYDTLVGLLSLGQEQKLRKATLDLARVKPGEKILEVGCGTGTLSLKAKVMAGPSGQVTGIDVAPDMLETARRKAAKAGLDVKFQAGRIEEIPFPDGQFDLVLSSLMMHHVPGDDAKQKGIGEILRVLKPGGRLVIVDVAPPENPHLRGLTSLLVGKEMLEHSVVEFRPMLEKAGFTGIETGPTSSSFLAYLIGKRPQD
jgi:demethylmenaquinone methyltransferase/2-methoxy-6-polyprenyl-1,4-benzoquinol methylase/phosphoethanolamine N-methyltransferase